MIPALAANPKARERFLREARATAGMEHEHIVTIHQVGEDRGIPYFAMPFLKGQPLDELLDDQASRCRSPRRCASARRSPRGWRRPTNRA